MRTYRVTALFQRASSVAKSDARRWIAALALSILASSAASARTAIEISPDTQAFYDVDVELQLTGTTCVALGPLQKNDTVTFNLAATKGTPLSLIVAPAGLPCENKVPEPSPTPSFVPIADDGEFFLAVRPAAWWLGENRLRGMLVRRRALAGEAHATTQQWMTELAAFVDQVFFTRPFTIRYRPCNYINAETDSATGDITLCSELIERIGQTNPLTFAIFLHELGHSLLSGWQEPGGNREQVADDFAVYMLLQLRGGIRAAQDFQTYLQTNSNPWIETSRIIDSRDPHPLGIQRANNIAQTLQDPDEFVTGWNRHIYPYMRTEWLQRIVISGRPYESAEIARQELARRSH